MASCTHDALGGKGWRKSSTRRPRLNAPVNGAHLAQRHHRRKHGLEKTIRDALEGLHSKGASEQRHRRATMGQTHLTTPTAPARPRSATATRQTNVAAIQMIIDSITTSRESNQDPQSSVFPHWCQEDSPDNDSTGQGREEVRRRSAMGPREWRDAAPWSPIDSTISMIHVGVPFVVIDGRTVE